MRLAHLIGPEIRDLLRNNPEHVRELFEELHPEDFADIVLELNDEEAGVLLCRLPADEAADIFARWPGSRQEALVAIIGMAETARIVTEMSADDRADFFSALPDSVGEQLLEALERYDPEAAEEVETLTQWPETSAGHLLTTDCIKTRRESTAADAIREVRRQGADVEIINYVYVVDEQGDLIGIASLRDILLADPMEPISEIMMENVISVTPQTDQEEVAKLMAKYDIQAVPVIDDAGKFLGIITIDDIVDVITEEQTEDIHKLGGVQPIEEPYFETTTWTFVKKRGFWLLLLFLGEMFTGTAMRHFDDVLSSVSHLSFYVPLLISTGGNSGGQSSTLIIRGMAVGEIGLRDWYRVMVREMVQGLLLGLVLALIGVVRVMLWGDGLSFAVLIGVSLVAISVMGCTVGGMLPLFIRRLGLDPATSSAPFIASLVDVFGILIYFSFARVLLANVIAAAGH